MKKLIFHSCLLVLALIIVNDASAQFNYKKKGAPAAILAAGASVFSAFRNRTLKSKSKNKNKSKSKRSSTYKA